MSDKDAGDSRQAALQKANDIYRAVVAATGSEHRLDRMGRNNLLPVDDAKYAFRSRPSCRSSYGTSGPSSYSIKRKHAKC